MGHVMFGAQSGAPARGTDKEDGRGRLLVGNIVGLILGLHYQYILVYLFGKGCGWMKNRLNSRPRSNRVNYKRHY